MKLRVELKEYESRRGPKCPHRTHAFLIIKITKHKKQKCDVERERNNKYQ
jgi:hypothetical protein